MPHTFVHDSHLLHLFVRNAIKSLIIGVYDVEQTAPQRLRINVDVWVSMPQGIEDNIENTFNYELLIQAIEHATQGAPYALQETFLERLLAEITKHPRVRHAHVQTEKLDVYPEAEGVGIGLWYHRQT